MISLENCQSTTSKNEDNQNREIIQEKVNQKEVKLKGCIEGDCINGYGKYIYDNGDIYEGNFKDSLRHGKGKMLYANGDSYEGNYSMDLREGDGTYIFSNGDSYTGKFKNGIRDGEGVYRFKDGSIYKGTFIADGSSGEGTFSEGEINFEKCNLQERRILCERNP